MRPPDLRLAVRHLRKTERPEVCSSLRPCAEMCGRNREEAMRYLEALENETTP